MQRIISKTLLTLLFFLVPLTLATAQHNDSDNKIYILKISSSQPDQPVLIKGGIFLYNDKSGENIEINQLTPYAMHFSTQMIGAVVKAPTDGPTIRVEISEKNENQEFTRISATGHIVVARQSYDGASYVSVN